MKKKVLMVVKTYPTPSRGYGETVCTAGIDLESGRWIRIYPFPFRTAEQYKKFKKYEIFEFNLQKSDARDKRPESFRLVELESAQKISEALPTKDHWKARLEFLLPTLLPNVNHLKNGLYDEQAKSFGQSIGLVQVRPQSAVVEFELDEPDWNESQAAKLEKAKSDFENNLFSTAEQIREFQTLEKLPYKIRLTFTDMSGENFSLLVTDWEIGVLFLKERIRVGEQKALENVKFKIEQEIFAATNDVYLVLGSVFGHFKQGTLVVIGFVYPKTKPKPVMDELF
jgi:hypothetical protein